MENYVFKLITNYYFSQYELRLAASDNLKENYTTVVIHVKDVNDNPPVFEKPTYRAQITEEDDRNLPKSVLRASVSMDKYFFVDAFSVVFFCCGYALFHSRVATLVCACFELNIDCFLFEEFP